MPNNGTNETIAGGGFHHLAIRARDYDETIRFYSEGLGCKKRYGWGADNRGSGGTDSRAAMLDTGDGNYIEVFARDANTIHENLPEGAVLHFALRTNDCDVALERARQAGAVVTMEVKEVVPPNAEEPKETFRIAFVKGPNEEVIEFFQNPNL